MARPGVLFLVAILALTVSFVGYTRPASDLICDACRDELLAHPDKHLAKLSKDPTQ